jgi:hypothetical protein
MSLPMGQRCGNPGDKCGMFTVPASGWCPRHDPQQAEIRRRQSSLAAKRSHEWKPDPEVIAWAETIDLRSPEGRARAMTEVARLVAQGGLSVGQGQAIASLARAAEGRPSKDAAKPVPQLIVEAWRSTNGDPKTLTTGGTGE